MAGAGEGAGERQGGGRVQRVPEGQPNRCREGTSVNPLHPPLPVVGVSIWTEKEHQQNDSLLAACRPSRSRGAPQSMHQIWTALPSTWPESPRFVVSWSMHQIRTALSTRWPESPRIVVNWPVITSGRGQRRYFWDRRRTGQPAYPNAQQPEDPCVPPPVTVRF